MTWQPIETAPKDGTQLILFYPEFKNGVVMGWFVDTEEIRYGHSQSKQQYWCAGAMWISMPFGKERPIPTHWMPVPTPP